MQRRSRRIGWRVSTFLGSLAGHAIVLLVVAMTGLARNCVPVASEIDGAWANRPVEPIDVTMIEPRPLNPLAGALSPEVQAAEVEKKVEEARKAEENPKEEGQVVRIAKPNVEIRPENSKYLAEYDNKVEHETKSRPGDGEAGAQKASRPVAVQGSHATPARQAVPQLAPQAATHGTEGKGALAMREASPVTDQMRGKEDGLERKEDGTEVPKGHAEPDGRSGPPGESRAGHEGQTGQEASEAKPEIAPQTGDLRPSDQLIAQAVGAGSNDYLKDVDEGEDTLLNTKRWKYASFFNRVMRGVSHTWRPDVAYRLRDPSGQIYGQKNRFTVLKVSLTPDGSLRTVLVEKPCGVDFLDDEAVTAFREAQPFPNPPDGLVDPASHLITFRFGFYFEIAGAPTFKVFRQ